ncbi:MAG: succinate--CoA ligase subunit beta [Desulfuromonadales bacterium C00003107]|jgi:succinyl-CoA synthetase beta subunit|nr:MAG: succinate--CoA ligase subunit beta [Desulfuromonadales bacterium C00003107]
MNLHEYQSKELFRAYGVPVPRGSVAVSAAEAQRLTKELGGTSVLKAQVYAGGRGKAGGVKLAKTPAEAGELATPLLGATLITPQTGPNGLPVACLLVEEAIAIEREFYLSITLDRAAARYCLIASAAGGVDIEETASSAPEQIHRQLIDPCLGLRSFQARRLALALGLRGSVCEAAVELMLNLYRLFLDKDCSLLEINPLVTTVDGQLLAMDAKINLDDNALFRHPQEQALLDRSQLDPLEVQAGRFDIAYIKMSGRIGCLVNGAGLAMATLDVLQECGGQPANFLDVGGGASREKIAEAFRIILQDHEVKGVFVNIFGGIMRCDIVAQGVIDAAAAASCQLPIVVRMAGAQVDDGKALLATSGLNVTCADGLGEGAARIVELLS